MAKAKYVAGREFELGFAEPNSGADSDVRSFAIGDAVDISKPKELASLKGLVANGYLVPADREKEFTDAGGWPGAMGLCTAWAEEVEEG